MQKMNQHLTSSDESPTHQGVANNNDQLPALLAFLGNTDASDAEEDVLLSRQRVSHAFRSYAESELYLSNERIGEALRSLGLMAIQEEVDELLTETALYGNRARGLSYSLMPLAVDSAPVGAGGGESLAYQYFQSVDLEKFTAIAHTFRKKELDAVGEHAGGSGGGDGAYLFKASEREVIEYKRAFRTFDKEDTGYVPVDRLGLILHQIGHHTSEEELDVIKTEIDRNGTGTLRFEHFLIVVSRLKQDECAIDELFEAFSVFDPDGTGLVEASAMETLMSSMCEELTPAEVKDLLYSDAAALDQNGMVDYRRLVYAMVKSLQRPSSHTL